MEKLQLQSHQRVELQNVFDKEYQVITHQDYL